MNEVPHIQVENLRFSEVLHPRPKNTTVHIVSDDDDGFVLATSNAEGQQTAWLRAVPWKKIFPSIPVWVKEYIDELKSVGCDGLALVIEFSCEDDHTRNILLLEAVYYSTVMYRSALACPYEKWKVEVLKKRVISNGTIAWFVE